jgi:ketosteroid isomerase-like protein
MAANVKEEVLKANTPGRNTLAVVLGDAMVPAAYRYAVEGVVRVAFGRLSAGDYQTLLMACASNVEHTFSGEHALGGTRHSKEALGRWFERLYSMFPGLNFEVKRVLVRARPWRTVAVVEWVDRARPADGLPYLNEGTHVLRFSWGRLVSLHAYLDKQKVEEVCERLAKEGIEEASAPPILT